MTSKTTPVAVITGASQGLGRALARELAGRGWSLVLDARHEAALSAAVRELPGGPHPAIAGDVADPAHRRDSSTSPPSWVGRRRW
jgi:NAD(P)-dependent dehydrogenase (short-subunit alcohol dehydrogenase family)